MVSKFFYLTLAVFVIAAFQNCSMEAQHSSFTLVSFKGCESHLERAFRDTGYYNLFRSKCASCHANGPGFGHFANADVSKAFEQFQSLGRARVERNLLNPAHQPPATGTSNQSFVNQHKQAWIVAEDQAASCAGSTAVASVGKTNATIHSATPTNNAAWPRVEWDLESEVRRQSLLGQIPLVVSIEVRRAIVNNQTVGYEFKNPSARVKNSGASYRLQGLRILLNDQVLPDLTTYSLLDAVISSTALTNLLPNTAFGLSVQPQTNSSDLFALQYEAILDAQGNPVDPSPNQPPPTNNPPPPPTSVTHADLVSNNQTLGVFSRACLNCHNSNNAAGGLNLSNYNAARNAANNIRSRMNNFNNPMPPSGVLPLADRQVVDTWINSGTPQQ